MKGNLINKFLMNEIFSVTFSLDFYVFKGEIEKGDISFYLKVVGSNAFDYLCKKIPREESLNIKSVIEPFFSGQILAKFVMGIKKVATTLTSGYISQFRQIYP